MNRFTVAILLLFFMALPVFSQESDTVIAVMNTDSIFQFGKGDFLVTDTLLVQPLEVKSPTKALMYALVLPGLGQAYNEKYYKMPIVWAALGGAGYAIVYNTKVYRQATIDFIEGNLDERYLPIYRRNMELSYIAAIVVYGLQILDAYVDAHLYSWDVNDNLSLGISPSLQPMMAPSNVTGYSCGLTCSFKIRGR